MSVHELADGRHLVALKGAPERVLDMCSRIRLQGRDEALTTALSADAHAACEAMAEDGQRVLAFCSATVNAKVRRGLLES